MTWNNSSISYPGSALAIQTKAESLISRIVPELNNSVSRLEGLKTDANYSRNVLSLDAEKLLQLRAKLENLLCEGAVLTVSPYQYQVGHKQGIGNYLSPQTAIEILSSKLLDKNDPNAPAGELFCIAIMLTSTELKNFASRLNDLVTVLALPDWGIAARQSTALSTNEVDKLIQPKAIIQPRLKSFSDLNAFPLKNILNLQGSQISTIESLANDKNNIIDKLKNLALKKKNNLNSISKQINSLKNLNGELWNMSLNGSAETIATKLKKAQLPNKNQYTVASLLLSNQPLTFFQELLCKE